MIRDDKDTSMVIEKLLKSIYTKVNLPFNCGFELKGDT